MMTVETRGSEWRYSLHIKLTRLAWELDLRVGRNDSQAGLRGDACRFLRCGNQRRNEFFREQAGREIGEAQKSCSGHVCWLISGITGSLKLLCQVGVTDV